MYTIKITNLVTGVAFPTETTDKSLVELKKGISFSAKYLRLNVAEWGMDGNGGIYAILKSGDNELQYKYEIILND